MACSTMPRWLYVQSLQLPFIAILQKCHVAALVCEYLPHSMSNNKLSTFLRLRATCRSTLKPITACMVRRMRLLKRHRLAEVRSAIQKIQDSGFMFHLLHCGGRPWRARFLLQDPKTGIPVGMAKQYWGQRQREKKITGWSADGKLHL